VRSKATNARLGSVETGSNTITSDGSRPMVFTRPAPATGTISPSTASSGPQLTGRASRHRLALRMVKWSTTRRRNPR